MSTENAKLLDLETVMARVTMKRTSIYGLIKKGDFPAPVKIGARSAWVDLEVTAWMVERMAARSPAARRAA